MESATLFAEFAAEAALFVKFVFEYIDPNLLTSLEVTRSDSGEVGRGRREDDEEDNNENKEEEEEPFSLF